MGTLYYNKKEGIMVITTGMIIRHKGERKVIRQVYRDKNGCVIIEFVDMSKSIDYQDIEFDGRK